MKGGTCMDRYHVMSLDHIQYSARNLDSLLVEVTGVPLETRIDSTQSIISLRGEASHPALRINYPDLDVLTTATRASGKCNAEITVRGKLIRDERALTYSLEVHQIEAGGLIFSQEYIGKHAAQYT